MLQASAGSNGHRLYFVPALVARCSVLTCSTLTLFSRFLDRQQSSRTCMTRRLFLLLMRSWRGSTVPYLPMARQAQERHIPWKASAGEQRQVYTADAVFHSCMFLGWLLVFRRAKAIMTSCVRMLAERSKGPVTCKCWSHT